MTSPSGCSELPATDDVAAEIPSRDSLDRLSWRSCSKARVGTASSSVSFWSFWSFWSLWSFLFFFRLRRASSSFENPLGPALLVSASPPCVLGLSVESSEDRPLLPIALDSAETVQERLDLFSFRLEEEESAMVGRNVEVIAGKADVPEHYSNLFLKHELYCNKLSLSSS
jgi:hypothetical protein